MVTPRRENRRLLQEALETVRELRQYDVPKPGQVYRVKLLLRRAGVPVPRPTFRPSQRTLRAIAAARRGETTPVDIDEL